jgi:RecA/RadA recombinase
MKRKLPTKRDSSPGNPFRIHGVVVDEFFTDRDQEIGRILKILREPASKLVVYGPRRMGKTSALVRAVSQHEAEGGVAFLADLATASTLVDVANRILESAGKALGRKWRDVINDLVAKMGVSLSLTPDPVSGLVLPSLDVKLRGASLEEQRRSLVQTLDAVEALAASRKATIGIVLDEFQEVERFGGESAEWHLRGIIQRHQHVSYVLAGSEAHLIERMMAKGRAFYGLLDQMRFGPIEDAHFAVWIDERMREAGLATDGIGEAIIAVAGGRTRDRVQVARQCFENCRARGTITPPDIGEAMDDIVAEQEAPLASIWDARTVLQQNVLRAVAEDAHGLTTKAAIERYGLTSSGAATNAAHAMVGDGILIKSPRVAGYSFDNPFFARWVVTETLGDLGASR